MNGLDDIQEQQFGRSYSVRNLVELRERIREYPRRPVVVSEGDSWFAYPTKTLLFGSGSNIVDHIEKKKMMNLLRLSSNGDEVVSMTTGKSKHRLVNILKTLEKIGSPPKVILFSGGGNDIVGPYDMPMLLKQKISTDDYTGYIHKTRFKRKLTQIKHAYLDLLDMRDEFCPDCAVVTHGYDWPIPGSRGAHFFGIPATKPWMQPHMIALGMSGADQKRVARYMIKSLNETLQDLKPGNKRFIPVKTTGTLAPNEWRDEIHATKKGFKKIANKIWAKMERHL